MKQIYFLVNIVHIVSSEYKMKWYLRKFSIDFISLDPFKTADTKIYLHKLSGDTIFLDPLEWAVKEYMSSLEFTHECASVHA